MQSYWLADPEPASPSLTVLELQGGRSLEVASVQGDAVFGATRPSPVDVVPARVVEA